MTTFTCGSHNGSLNATQRAIIEEWCENPRWVLNAVKGENDGEVEIVVNGLAIDGLDVSNFTIVDNPFLTPGATATLRVLQCDGFARFHEWIVFTVLGTDGNHADYEETRALRLHEPRFFVGDWNDSGGGVFTDPEEYLDPLIEPPLGFEPESFLLVKSGNETELDGEKIGPNRWRFTLSTLHAAEQVAVIPEP